ncbi:MAG: hypothetical protein ACP6IU_03410 [Candidatus Asgardarchaeia archaeon]
MEFPKLLEEAGDDYNKIFKLVKKLVREKLNLSRGSMLLGITYTSPNIGAYHTVGSNAMILNQTVIDAIKLITKNQIEINSYIFVVLLHEYLHSLGYLSEREVRPLTLKLCFEAFGPNHPTTKMALDPFSYFPNLLVVLSRVKIPAVSKVTYIGNFDDESARFYL